MSARCLACGGEAVARERRVLNSEATHNVVAAWKEIVQLKAIELHVSLSEEFLGIAGTERSDRPGCMCRKCFSMFERYLRIRETLLSNIHAAITRLLRVRYQALQSMPTLPMVSQAGRDRLHEDDSATQLSVAALGNSLFHCNI